MLRKTISLAQLFGISVCASWPWLYVALDLFSYQKWIVQKILNGYKNRLKVDCIFANWLAFQSCFDEVNPCKKIRWERIFVDIYTEKKCIRKNDTFNRVIDILVNWHILTGILTRITNYYGQNACWSISIYWNPNDWLKHVVYVLNLCCWNETCSVRRLFLSRMLESNH